MLVETLSPNDGTSDVCIQNPTPSRKMAGLPANCNIIVPRLSIVLTFLEVKLVLERKVIGQEL